MDHCIYRYSFVPIGQPAATVDIFVFITILLVGLCNIERESLARKKDDMDISGSDRCMCFVAVLV